MKFTILLASLHLSKFFFSYISTWATNSISYSFNEYFLDIFYELGNIPGTGNVE